MACAAALANLEIFETENVFERIDAIASGHRGHLRRISSHPRVDEVRQIGSVAAIELKAEDHGYSSNLRARLYKDFFDRGVLLRPLGNVVYILPPYVITLEELDYIYGVIEEALEKI